MAFHRVPVAANEGPRVSKAVLDCPPHERFERLGWRAGRLDQLRRDLVQRDQKARGERRRRVVDRAVLVVELESLEPEQVSELASDRHRLVGLTGHCGPGAVELLGTTFGDEGLKGMKAEALFMRVERCETGCAARVADPLAGRERGGNLGDRSVRDAEKDEIGVPGLELPARRARGQPVGQAAGHGFADASSADDANGMESQLAPVPSGYRAGVSVSVTLNPMEPKVQKSEEDWRRELTPEQYRVLREKGTERAFTGKYHATKDAGMYRCAACGAELFSSDTKFDSGTGWPSFYEPAVNDAVDTEDDSSLFMRRTEVICSNCGSHLGHVFPDGPRPTGLRYCINSCALDLDRQEVKDG